MFLCVPISWVQPVWIGTRNFPALETNLLRFAKLLLMQQASGEGIHHPQFVGISCTSTHHRLIVECPTKLHFSAKDWYSYSGWGWWENLEVAPSKTSCACHCWPSDGKYYDWFCSIISRYFLQKIRPFGEVLGAWKGNQQILFDTFGFLRTLNRDSGHTKNVYVYIQQLSED